jgi:hypothetical protein
MAASLKFMIAVCAASIALCGQAQAGPQSSLSVGLKPDSIVELAKAKKGARVKGYVERRGGGYSYDQADTINTHGDSRSKFGGASSLRDPSLDKQTDAGPFDHGFFFDSAVGARGGDAPYQN